MVQALLVLTALSAVLAGNLTGTWTGDLKDAEGGGAGAYLQLTHEGALITGATGASKDLCLAHQECHLRQRPSDLRRHFNRPGERRAIQFDL